MTYEIITQFIILLFLDMFIYIVGYGSGLECDAQGFLFGSDAGMFCGDLFEQVVMLLCGTNDSGAFTWSALRILTIKKY